MRTMGTLAVSVYDQEDILLIDHIRINDHGVNRSFVGLEELSV